MPSCLKLGLCLLLTLMVVPVFHLRAAGSTGLSTAGYMIPAHKVSYTGGQHYQQASASFHAGSKKTTPPHHHRKARKKIFPVKIMAHHHAAIAEPVMNYVATVHATTLRYYRFLYFRQINPPPPKA